MGSGRDVGSVLPNTSAYTGVPYAGPYPGGGGDRNANPDVGWGGPCWIPELKLAASVSLQLDSVHSAGETPDGVRLTLLVHGTVYGPMLNGTVPPVSANILVDVDNLGTLHVRAPIVLDDGAVLEIEATVRYRFGPAGYRDATTGSLPDSAVEGCLRFLTGHPRYQWVNRALLLGVGELRANEKRVDYDVFLITPRKLASASRTAANGEVTAPRAPGSLYDRLGRREGIYALMSAAIDSLNGNEQLNRQNPKLASAATRVNLPDMKKKVADFVCRLTGGPCTYTGRTMRASHAPLDITESDWKIFIDDFVRVMNEFRVANADQDDLLALLVAMKADILKPA
jgi:hemoglobin